MGLSEELISQFAKITKDDNKSEKETTVYGTIVEYDGKKYVKLDGSDRLTPVSTTASTKADERVTVMIKDHKATITGNISSPSASSKDLDGVSNTISEFGTIISYKVTAEDIEAVNAVFESLKSKTASITDLEAINAEINNLQAKYAELEYISATDMEVLNADIEKLEATFADITDLSVEELDAINADIDQLKAYNADFVYVSADVLQAIKAEVDNADIKYAKIDFTNIGKATMEYFYAQSGLVENVTISDGTITGNLVGVTIKGDLIEGNTIVADKLVIKGEDGMYYKLNTVGQTSDPIYYVVTRDTDTGEKTVTTETIESPNGVLVEGVYTPDGREVYTTTTDEGEELLYCIEEGKLITDLGELEAIQTEYNSINGSVITAKSITATKVSVDDLVAFDATIGGFNITEKSIYSEIKDSEGNQTRGIYMDTDGQINFGDSRNFIKYYKDEDGEFHLAISAESILFALNGNHHSIEDLGAISEFVKIGVYEDEPCIELGEGDSNFKLIITNTRILFMDDTETPAYVTNKSLYIEKAVVTDELQFGGFVWQKRSNGNIGLVWKGETE